MRDAFHFRLLDHCPDDPTRARMTAVEKCAGEAYV
jgi:hypothetical protein